MKADPIKPPKNSICINTIEMHTAGEPLRVVVDGFPESQGASVLEYRRLLKDKHDHLRRALMYEPRGHADMYGCVVIPSSQADLGVVFMHNEGYSTMCGHATIALGKLAVESGWVKIQEGINTFKLEAPCGIVTLRVEVKDGQATQVGFYNVPSFVWAQDQEVKTDNYGTIEYELAYGGAFYAVINAQSLGLLLNKDHSHELIQAGIQIKRAIVQQTSITHPFEPDLGFLYGTIFTGPPHDPGNHSRNVCIFAEGELDRCPTGSGVSARLALLHQREEVSLDQWITVESIIGSEFKGRVTGTTMFGSYEAVIPYVQGSAFYTGRNQFWIDPNDPLNEGFLLR